MSSHGHDAHASAPAKSGFDLRDVNAVAVTIVGLAIVGIVVGTMFAVNMYYEWTQEKLTYERQLVPVSSDFRNLRATEQKELETYGFVDKAAGVVRIPIDRAMDLLVAEAAEGKLKYPTQPQEVKPPADPNAPAGAPAAAPVAGGTPVAKAAAH